MTDLENSLRKVEPLYGRPLHEVILKEFTKPPVLIKGGLALIVLCIGDEVARALSNTISSVSNLESHALVAGLYGGAVMMTIGCYESGYNDENSSMLRTA